MDSYLTRLAELRQVSLDSVDLPANPARRFLCNITELAESMQEYGLQQPISVRQDGDRFILTSGSRRIAAARMLGWQSIDAFVRTLNADDAYVVDLVENLQRDDLSAEDEADALRELVRARGWNLHQVAAAVKHSVAYVSKRVRVFEDPELREAVTQRALPISTAEELLAAEPEKRHSLIERALAEHWDQARAREAVRPLEPELSGTTNLSSVSRGIAPDDRPVKSRQSVSRGVDARPRGFTRAVREFHQMIVNLHAEELTTADRSALRSLFRDLVLLARAPMVQRATVFPALPPVSRRARLQPMSPRGVLKRQGPLGGAR